MGEKAIATSVANSYLYAKNILKGPFPLGEKIITASARYSYEYARDRNLYTNAMRKFKTPINWSEVKNPF